MSRPVIIDCDPGTDDAIALWLALASPELDVLAITTVGGNLGLPRTLANALAIRALVGADVPVHAGADRPLLGSFRWEVAVHGADGLGGVSLAPGGEPTPGIAADAIRTQLRAASAPVTLIGLGPATNLALALATEPVLTDRVQEIVLMTGAWGEGNCTPDAECNAWNDPEALAVLLASGRPVTIACLDLTAQAFVTPERVAALRTPGAGRCLTAARDILAATPPSRRFAHHGFPLHDPCTVAWLIAPELFTSRACAVAVDLGPGPSRGRTVIDRWKRTGAAPNEQVLETLDAEGFFALLAERLARLP